MPRAASRTEVISAVRELAHRRPHRSVFVGIDGFGGSGKTTLAGTLAQVLDRVVVVAVDDLQGAGVTEWDWERLRRQAVEPLLAGADGHYDLVRWGETEPYGRTVVAAGSVMVLEGVSATRAEAGIPWDLTVWVDTGERTRRDRVLKRDGAALQPLWREWVRSERRYARQQRPWERVDLVVPGGTGLG